jgi:hypothetical protein
MEARAQRALNVDAAIAQFNNVNSDAYVVYSGSAMMASSQSFSNIQRRISCPPQPALPVRSGEAFATRSQLRPHPVKSNEPSVMRERLALKRL